MKETIDLPKAFSKNWTKSPPMYIYCFQSAGKDVLKSLFCTEFLKFVQCCFLLLTQEILMRFEAADCNWFGS